MGYDLFLTSPSLSADRFVRHFANRPHYNSPGSYINEDTGVYFQFEYSTDSDRQSSSEGRVAFSLNYIRPHVFGLEAEPEVAAFVEAFDCKITDPQSEGMGSGPYSSEGFLRGWNKGNRVGYEVIAERTDLTRNLIVDEAAIEKVWLWNFHRQVRQSEFGEDRFLPRLNWARRPADRATIIFPIWTEGVCSAFPECATHVLLARTRNVSIGLLKGKEEILETKLVSINEISALKDCTWSGETGNRILLTPTNLSKSRQISAIFGGQFERTKPVEPVAPDHVLGAELMAQALQTAIRQT